MKVGMGIEPRTQSVQGGRKPDRSPTSSIPFQAVRLSTEQRCKQDLWNRSHEFLGDVGAKGA